MSETSPFPPVRRVITGHNAEGKAVFIKDELQEEQFWTPGSKDGIYNIHATETVPASNDSELTTGSFVDTIATLPGLYPPSGVGFRVFNFGPGSTSKTHRTHSLDYGIVMAGEITLELDDGKTTVLKRGDVVCMRGTAHSWRNEGTEWVQYYGIILAAKPITVNGEELKESYDLNA